MIIKTRLPQFLPLFFRFQMLIVPTHRVFIDVFSTSFIIISITNNMLGRGTLKHFFYSKSLLAAARSQGFKRTNYIIQGRGGACSSRLFVQKYNRVDMVRHNDIIFNRYTWETSFNQPQLLFYNLTARLQSNRDFGRSKPLPYR